MYLPLASEVWTREAALDNTSKGVSSILGFEIQKLPNLDADQFVKRNHEEKKRTRKICRR